MATHDGAQAQGTNSVTRSFTAGALGVISSKWEGGATPSASFSDGTDTWTLVDYQLNGTEPGEAIYECLNVSAASRTITPTFSAGSATFQHIEVDSFISSLGAGAWARDGAATKNTGATTNNYSCPNITTTAAGVVVFGVGDFNALGTISSTGSSPAFDVTGGVNGDAFSCFLLSGSAQTVTPGAQVTSGGTKYAAVAQAWKEAVAGTTVTPGAGSLALAGQAPAAISPVIVTPGAGALRVTGQEPQLLKHLTTPGDMGVLSYVAGESLVGGLEPPQVTTAQPSAGALTLAGTISTVTVSGGSGTTVAPAAGALTLAGQAPTTLQNVIRAPSAGALALVGLAPAAIQNLIAQPGAGAVVLAGQAPTTLQNLIRAPSAGALTLAGLAPAVLTPVTATPNAGALTLSGQAPTVLVGFIAQPGAGALVLAGQDPVLLQDAVRTPAAGALALAGQAPTTLVGFKVQPAAGALVLAGEIPAVLNGDAKVAQPAAGALVLAGQAPTVLTAISAQPGAGALVLAGRAPTVQATQSAQPAAGALALAGLAPTLSVTANVVANPLTGALVITGLTPTAAASDHRTVSPGAGALVLDGQAPTIPVPSPTVSPDPGALLLEGLAPGIVVTGDDGLLSAKLIARRPNVRVKGLQPDPAPTAEPLAPEITNMPGTEEVVRKARGLNLGLITAPPAAPAPNPAPVEVPPIGATVPAGGPAAAAGPPPAAPQPAESPAPAPEPAPPPAPVTQDYVQEQIAALHKQILEAASVRAGETFMAIDDLAAKVEALEADIKARDLKLRNMLRAKQITERMLRDLEK